MHTLAPRSTASGSLRLLRVHRLRPPWFEPGERTVLALAAIVFFCLRIPFLPPTLDNIDGINFDLGVHDYAPVVHQPHPPGYPVFIFVAKLIHPFIASHAAALAFLSVLFGSLSVFPLYFLLRELTSRGGAALACVLTLMSPLVWFNSVRPMSDLTGFFTVLVSQCLLLKGALRMNRDTDHGRRLWHLGVVAAGLAMGVRLQTIFLVGPMLIYGWIRHRQVRRSTPAWLAGSVAVWWVPLIQESGGPAEYMRSLTLLIGHALPVEPLLSAPTIHRAAFALWDVLGAPWGTPWLAVPVLLSGALGAVLWILSNRRAVGWALLLFLPYAIYHYLLQMTATTRYAIPIVPLVALFAVVPLVYWRRPSRPLVAASGLAFVAMTGTSTVPALLAYHRTSSPSALALTHVRDYGSGNFVVSGHHVFERYLSRLRAEFTVLPSVPERPLRPLFEYWKQGGRKRILFLRDPMRASLLLVGRDTQTALGQWSWPSSLAPFMKGERPSNVELAQLDPPRWFCETGFLVTAEAGDPNTVAREEHRAYLRPSPRRRVLIASGTVLDAPDTDLTLRVGDAIYRRRNLPRDFVVRQILDPLPASGYVPLLLSSSAPVLFDDFWVEREDRPVIRPATGFYFAERDSQGKVFRWMTPQAEAVAYLPGGRARLRISGRIPLKYYQLPVTLSFRWDGHPLATVAIATADFSLEVDVPSKAGAEPWSTLTVTSSHQFVPDEWQKSGDRRNLSARIYELSLTALPFGSRGEENPR